MCGLCGAQIRFEGVQHRHLHFGVVTTMQPNAEGLRVVAIAGDFEAPVKPPHVAASSGV
jgi:hypothetical protein